MLIKSVFTLLFSIVFLTSFSQNETLSASLDWNSSNPAFLEKKAMVHNGDTLFINNIMQEISEISISYKNTSKEKSDQNLELKVIYDDRIIESKTGTISGNLKNGKLNYKLDFGNGRKVVHLELIADSMVNFQYLSSEYLAAKKAVSLNDNELGQAKLNVNGNRENDILFTYRPINNPPHLTGLKSSKLKFTLLPIDELTGKPADGSIFIVYALTEDRTWFEEFKIEVEKGIREYPLDLGDADINKGIFLIFQTDYRQPTIAIRNIKVDTQ